MFLILLSLSNLFQRATTLLASLIYLSEQPCEILSFIPLFNENYFNDIPFKDSGYALYHWAPIAEDLKKLDKEVVLNSMAYKWNAVVSDFKKLSRDAKNF